MSTSHPIFKIARPDTVPDWIIQVVSIVQHTAGELGLKFLIVGATARDIIFQGVFGLPAGRQTVNLDFGLAVENWGQFSALRSALIATNHFQPMDQGLQRLRYQANQRIDLIPFGGIADKNGVIAWPPSQYVVFNVTGFEEALASAIRVQIAPELIVPVVSLAGLAVLKLFAWADQRDKANSDADDLHRLMNNYGNAGNEDRLYGDEFHLLEKAESDFELAGARLLGKDAAGIVSTKTAAKITELLRSEKHLERLLAQMLQAAPVIDEQMPTRYAELLEAFREGFLNG